MTAHIPGETNEAFAALGRIVLGDQPLAAILEQVVHIATRVMPTPTDASITLIAGDEPSTVAFTSDMALALDERQYEAERGPCVDAATSGHLIRIADMRVEERWPRFAKAAVERGVLSSLSVPLPVQRHVTGALNFYSTRVDAFSDEAVDLAETFGAHAAVATANAHLYETTAALGSDEGRDGHARRHRAGERHHHARAGGRRRRGVRCARPAVPAVTPQAARHRATARRPRRERQARKRDLAAGAAAAS